MVEVNHLADKTAEQCSVNRFVIPSLNQLPIGKDSKEIYGNYTEAYLYLVDIIYQL